MGGEGGRESGEFHFFRFCFLFLFLNNAVVLISHIVRHERRTRGVTSGYREIKRGVLFQRQFDLLWSGSGVRGWE